MRREDIPDRCGKKGQGRRNVCDVWWEAGLYDSTLNLGKSFNAFGTIIPTTFGEEEMEGGIGREGKPHTLRPCLECPSVGVTTGFPSSSVGDSLPDRKKF